MEQKNTVLLNSHHRCRRMVVFLITMMEKMVSVMKITIPIRSVEEELLREIYDDASKVMYHRKVQYVVQIEEE